ncbi:Beta-hexosaminidase [bioreactor metagenome]|uniref:beta-N-acetylhexosaminidase n=1 Tax=bioreactor metagenome TaxID=1076179 RepID=A0A645B4H6_9ZZZZ
MKRWPTYLLILFLLALAVFLGANYFRQRQNVAENPVPQPSVTPTPVATSSKAALTDKERILQMIAIPVTVTDFLAEQKQLANEDAKKLNSSASAELVEPNAQETWSDWITDRKPGFVVYFGSRISTESATLASASLHKLYPENFYQPLIMVDHEGASVQRLQGTGFSRLDSWANIVEKYNSEEQVKAFRQSAQQVSAAGVNIVLAPVLDIASGSAILQSRASDDEEKLAVAAENYIKTFSQYHLMPVIKHYPGIGQLSSDLHTSSGEVALRSQDTAIFSKILTQFPNIGVMTTHVSLKDKFNGQPCSLTAECLKPLTENFPEALLVTDDLSMKSALEVKGREQSLSEAAIAAVRAGNSVLLFGPDVSMAELDQVIADLLTQYQDSASFQKAVDLNVARILQLKSEQ